MANVMSMKGVKNHAHRDGFDLSTRVGFSAKVGEILPVFWKTVYPGDTFKVNAGSFSRTSPVNTAAYTRIKEYYDYYFVPMRLLWDKFPQWAIKTKQPQYASSSLSGAHIDTTCPYITDLDFLRFAGQLLEYNPLDADVGVETKDEVGLPIFQQFYKLADCLGYSSILKASAVFSGTNSNKITSFKVPTTPTAMNIWPWLAYQKIYSDHFRYDQWQGSLPYLFNLDYVLNENQLHLNPADYTDVGSYVFSPFALRYANYHKDYFTGMLPNSQFGDVTLAGPLSGYLVFDGTGTESGSANLFVNSIHSHRSDNISASWVQKISSSTVDGNGNTRVAGISALAIRQAMALQKYNEIIQANGYDYKSQIEAHWDVNVSSLQSDRCIRVGGFDSQVSISEVVNQALDANNPANIAGKGVGSGRGSFRFKNDTNEYGIFMCVYHAVPLLDYTQDTMLDRDILKIHPDDLVIPEMDNIGMQETHLSEIYTSYANYRGSVGLKLNIDPIGFAPRYAEYKTSRDVVRGSFASRGDAGYSDWVAPVDRDFLKNYLLPFGSTASESVPGDLKLSWTSFYINPTMLNSIFLSQVISGDSQRAEDYNLIDYSDDQLIINSFHSLGAVRNFSSRGLPY